MGISEDHLLALLFIVVVLIGLSMMSTSDPPAARVEPGVLGFGSEGTWRAGEQRDAVAKERAPDVSEAEEDP